MQDRRLDRAGEDHRAAPHRGARAGPGRDRGPRRHHRDRRHSRDHDRRDPGRPERPAPAPADHGRRARDLDDDRHQHLAAGRPREGHQGDRPPGQGPSRPRAHRQRVAAGHPDRAAGRVGGPRPRRARARDPGRDHAPRGLRADRRPPVGGDQGDQRQGARAGRAALDRRPRGVPRRGHPAGLGPPGPDGDDDQPRHRLGPARLRRPVPRPDRVPHPVPDRDPRHRDRAPRLRGLRALGRA